ncbi:MAG: hypothetical protein VX938_10540, partial [Myxococcota bacterium]|nr:hypothetical protein [Myxococcota bacterium]
MHHLMASAGFVVRRSTAEEIWRYVRGREASSAARLGVISNPMARTNWRTRGHERLRRLLPCPEDAVSTPAMRDIPWALDYLLFQRGCNVLGINGGDGTIHQTLQALAEVTESASQRCGAPVPLPLLVLLNGGGMNMVARVVDTRADPGDTIRRFLTAHGGRPIGQIPTERLGLLEVRAAGCPPRLGFVFGSLLVRNALTLYERMGRGYVGLTRLLFRAGAGAWLDTREWREHRHLLTAPDSPLWVDDELIQPYAVAVAATIPLSILRGTICALPRVPPPGQMDGLVVESDVPSEIIRLIPAMMSAGEVAGLR